MATQVTKRVASIFLDGAQPQKSLKELQATATKLYNELRKLPRGTDEFVAKAKEYRAVQAQLKAVKDEVAGTDGVFGSLRKSLGPMAGAMGLAFGGTAVLGAIRHSRDEFLEHEKAVDRVTLALKNNGSQSGQTASGLVNASDALELKSLHKAEDILNQVSTQLLNFGTISGENFSRAQQASVDLATVMEGDLQGATMALGKALNDPAEGLAKLGRMGVVFSDQQKEVIKSLAETGHMAEAQGMILDELEKRYAGQAEAAAKNVEGTRKLDQAWGDLVEGAGGGFNEALQDIAGSLGSLLGTMGEWLGATHKQSDELQGQRIEMNALFNVLKSGNITTEQQAELVARINKEYQGYLPTAISVTDSTEQLTAAQNGANAAMLENIKILAKKELLEEAQAAAVDAEKYAMEAQVKAAKAAQGEISAWDRVRVGLFNPAAMLSAGNFIQAESVRAQLSAKEAVDSYNAMEIALGGTVTAQKAAEAAMVGKGPQGSGPLLQQGEEGEEVSKRAVKVREALQEARRDIEKDQLEGAAAEIRAVEWKYHKIAEEAKGSGVGLEEIEAQQAEEIAAIRTKYGAKEVERLKKLDQDLRKIRTDQVMSRLTIEQREEVEVINARYEAQRTAISTNSQALAVLEAEYRKEITATANTEEVQAINARFEVQRAALTSNSTTLAELEVQHRKEIASAVNTEERNAIDARYQIQRTAIESNSVALAALEAEYHKETAKALSSEERTAIDARYEIQRTAMKANSTTLAELEVQYRKEVATAVNTEERNAIDARYEIQRTAIESNSVALAALEAQYHKEITSTVNTADVQAINERYEAQRTALASTTTKLAELEVQQRREISTAVSTEEVAAINRRYEAQRTAISTSNAALTQLEVEYRKEISTTLEENRIQRQTVADETELQQIRDKYTKLIEEAKGNATRTLELQDLLNVELEAKELEQDAKRQARMVARQEAEDEWNAGLQQIRLDQAQQQLDLLTTQQEAELASHEEQGLALNDLLLRQAEERAPLEEELRQAQVDAINEHFETLYAQADAAGIDSTELQRMHGNAILLMKQGFADAEVENEKEKNAKILASDLAVIEAKRQTAQSLASVVGDIFAMSAGDADEAADFHKMLTLFQIGIDTAASISALTAVSEANPLNAVTFGSAGMLQWAAGIARITANMAKAQQLLSKPKPKAPAFAIGGETEGNSFFGKRSTSNTFSDQEEIMNYFDDQLGTNVSITKPPQNISVGGKVQQPTLGLFGEKGAEWVAPNWQYSHPTLRPVFNWLEDMRQDGRVPAFEVGGPTSTGHRVRGTAFVNMRGAPGPGGEDVVNLFNSGATQRLGAGADPDTSAMLALVATTLDKLNTHLDNGIGVNNDLLEANDKRLSSIRNQADLNA